MTINLKELAEKLGLSQTTVSRALNGYPEVNEATRHRVQQAAVEFNYRPNSRAKSLATGRAMMIGHVIPISNQHEMVNPVFGDFVAGASRTYAHHGYDMMFTRVEDGNEEAAYRLLKAKGSVDGVIIQGPSINDKRIPMLHALELPFVVHGRSTETETPYTWVDVNNTRAFRRATEFLLDLGHRRVALINGLEHMDFARRRRNGYVAALENAGITLDPDLMVAGEMTEVIGHHSMRDMLKLDNPPTAVLTASMISALGVRRAIDEAGLTIGRDVSVITHDDDLSYLKNGENVPIFTATRSSVRKAGELLAELLIDHIADPSLSPQNKLLEAELVVGRSTGPAPVRNGS